MNQTARDLLRRIEAKEALVGVIGMGYVGLPRCLRFVETGFTVLGFDVDSEKVARLGRGESYISHIPGSSVLAAAETGRFESSNDFGRSGEPDALLICVPTPLAADRKPDTTFIESTTEQIASCLRPGQLIVLESTTYPGTTDELVKPILERNGLVCGEDFFLGYSPERESPGDPVSTGDIPKVVSGVDEISADLVQALYTPTVAQTVRMSSVRAAEATKLSENVFRSVNIALVNELKMIFDAMDLDVWEVLDAAQTKPFGYMRFDPGPGWGGHCIPIDPFYLSWQADRLGQDARFIELAGQINTSMPQYVVDRAALALKAHGKSVGGARVLIIGLAYKPNVGDDRESPSYRLMDLFAQLGADVDYYDPHLTTIPTTREHAEWAGRRSVKWSQHVIEGYDVAVIATAHDALDYAQLGEWVALIVDARNAMARVEDPAADIWKA